MALLGWSGFNSYSVVKDQQFPGRVVSLQNVIIGSLAPQWEPGACLLWGSW